MPWLTTLCRTGWQLGSDPEIQVATVISNHLTAGIMKYFGDSFRYEHAANLFEKLVEKEPEVASLLATSYIGMSEWHKRLKSCRRLLLTATLSQMRKSRRSRFCQRRCTEALILITCCMHSVISSVTREGQTGP